MPSLDRNQPGAFLSPIRTTLERKVAGLRNYEKPSDVRVYKVNPDGSQGELLRTESPQTSKLDKAWWYIKGQENN